MSNNPHPQAKCPLCGTTKPHVLWIACCELCADLMAATPKRYWALPEAPIGKQKPFLLKKKLDV